MSLSPSFAISAHRPAAAASPVLAQRSSSTRETARAMIADARIDSGPLKGHVDTDKLAGALFALRQGDAAKAAGIEKEVFRQIPDAGDKGRLHRAIDKLASEGTGDTGNTGGTRPADKHDEAAQKASIDMPHILDGYLNKRGKAVGYHHRPNGQDPATSRMVEQTSQPNKAGIYTGKVEIKDPQTGKWVAKRAQSSFYPDRFTAKQVETAIRSAYADALRNNKVSSDGAFTGDSGMGFKIQGYASAGKIATAYPLYVK